MTEFHTGAHVKRASARKVIVELVVEDEAGLKKLSRLAVTWLAQQGQVLWIEEAREMTEMSVAVDQSNINLAEAWGERAGTASEVRSISRDTLPSSALADSDLRNDDAVGTAQGGSDPRARLHQAGFLGFNQTVALADSGLDYDGCYFHDESPSAHIQICDEGAESDCAAENGTVSHRKVIAYRVFTYGRLGDEEDGHGTHVAGSIAGNANLAPLLGGGGGRTKDDNGAAPHARLVFEDGSPDGGSPFLYFPADKGDGRTPLGCRWLPRPAPAYLLPTGAPCCSGSSCGAPVPPPVVRGGTRSRPRSS